MKKILINYADRAPYRVCQKFNSQTAIGEGLFDKVISYGSQDIDADFWEKNKEILSIERGGGYWLWKPYILKKTLADLEYGDFVFYLDCDHLFISPVMPIIETCLRTQQDIISYQLPKHIEKNWTKRDAFILMDCDKPKYTDTPQNMATFFLLRKSDFSERFVDEWLTYVQDERIISNKPNQCGYPNYPGFHENRHDQSIFSLLTKKHGLQAYKKWPPVIEVSELFYSYSLIFRRRTSIISSPPPHRISPSTMRRLAIKYPISSVRFILQRKRRHFLAKISKIKRSVFPS